MPARLREIILICARYGISVEKPKKGSHWKCRRDGDGVYPIPAHNGERSEISDQYIRALCRHFDIDYDELKRLLGQ